MRAESRPRRRSRAPRPPRALTLPTDLAATYPEELPVTAARDQIVRALRSHQVVVIAGETGSGKTTQIPKMCLEAGLLHGGIVGHTQPRRIAARSVAERIAEELGEAELGGTVGYQVRFTDRTGDRTAIKVMTDGILLAELQRDPDLRAYDVLIVDEAHERSLTIDFILGYLKALLQRRSDLRVVITSATIDPDRFARHFATGVGGELIREVPVIEVSGRTFPVEVRYRPLVQRTAEGRIIDERDQVSGIVEAVAELWTELSPGQDATDILVFLSGEREIKDAAEALEALALPGTEILPLYARLSAAEQHRVFRRGPGRRVILATNVAETSLTVPGIGFVVDTGTARISRFSQRTKVQRLPIEPISRASAAQRAGRCGRIAPGVAIRLYSEEDFESRPEFTEPEILRTSLAAVMLQMAALRLGDLARFPFVEPPDQRQVTDGARLLTELGAFTAGHRLTATGRTLARLPVDPRLGRMIVEADRLGCVREVLPIVAALSIQDPRERPEDQRERADQAHARFVDKTSDFATVHGLWSYLQAQQRALSGSAFRRLCRAEYLHYLRIREWQDLHAQLRGVCRGVGIDPARGCAVGENAPDWDRVHQALLAGLLSHVGLRDEVRRDYLGARGARFAISPGSALARRQPDFVMAGELVETTRIWGHRVAAIDPAWAEQAGAHLVARSYSEPRWSRRQGAVLASERVTLYGIPLVVDRPVQFARIDPVAARELFVRRALVEGDWESRHEFWRSNSALIARVGELEERARRRDLTVSDEALFAFYDARIPQDVLSARHFERWWRGESRRNPHLLTLTEADIREQGAGAVLASDYPGRWRDGDLELDLTYQFSPGEAADGVTVHIPAAQLNQVSGQGLDWLVPGMREDLIGALLRSLPKEARRLLVPVPDTARALLNRLDPARGGVTQELARVLKEERGVSVAAGDFDWDRVPAHLRVTFSVEGRRREVLASGKDLRVLRGATQPAVRERIARAGAELERSQLTAFPEDGVPESFAGRSGRLAVTGYPALVDEGGTVAVRVLDDPDLARDLHHGGVRRLLLGQVAPPWKRILAGLSTTDKLTLAHNPHGSVPALLADAVDAAVDDILADLSPQPVRTATEFAEALGAVRTHVPARALAVVRAALPVLDLAHRVRQALAGMVQSQARGRTPAHLAATIADATAQLDSLIRPGFLAATGLRRIPDLERYLRALDHRLNRAATNAREGALQGEIDTVEEAYAVLLAELPQAVRGRAQVREIGWMIEELRVSLFAQSLGTAYPVSTKRVLTALGEVRRGMAGPRATLPS